MSKTIAAFFDLLHTSIYWSMNLKKKKDNGEKKYTDLGGSEKEKKLQKGMFPEGNRNHSI